MSYAKSGSEHTVNEFLSVAKILEQPRLARIYMYVFKHGDVTVEEIVDSLNISQSTAYSDVEGLVELGFLNKQEEEKPHRITANPIKLQLQSDGDEYTVTPTLIEAVSRSIEDEDIETFIDRNGIGKLAAALEYAKPYVEGKMSERIASRELGLNTIEGITILHALREVILDIREMDPYFEDIGDARNQ